MNAITLLKNDHRKLERLFERYRATTADGKAEILRGLSHELSRHMVAEEKELYPALRESLPDGWLLTDPGAHTVCEKRYGSVPRRKEFEKSVSVDVDRAERVETVIAANADSQAPLDDLQRVQHFEDAVRDTSKEAR